MPRHFEGKVKQQRILSAGAWIESGKRDFSKSEKRDVIRPSGFAKWHLLKLGYYPPTETGRSSIFRHWLEKTQNSLADLRLPKQIMKGAVAMLLGSQLWVVRNGALSVCVRVGVRRWMDLLCWICSFWRPGHLRRVWLEFGEGDSLCQQPKKKYF